MLGNLFTFIDWITVRIFLFGGIIVVVGMVVEWRRTKKSERSLGRPIALSLFAVGAFAIHFLFFQPLFIERGNERNYLVEHGVEARGCILYLQDTNIYINGRPVLRMGFEYQFKGERYEAELQQEIPFSILSEIRTGQCYPLLVDPEKPTRIILG